MKLRPHLVIHCALAAVMFTWGGAALRAATEVAATSPTTASVSAPASAPAVPYSREPLPEIAKLSPAPNTPTTAEELKAVQARVEAVAQYALPAIVNVMVSDGQGSGVIVSKDGYVLTAGHVSGKPHEQIHLRLSNGTIVTGVTLGANDQFDSGMVKITAPGDYPYMPVGSTSKMRPGQWVVAMGHPGGYELGRPPVVRLGKVLSVVRLGPPRPQWYVQTDCPLIMGDSGGPVFDLNGCVVAINSRIGLKQTTNVHVPIDTFTDTWDRLARGDQWGGGGLARVIGNPAMPPTPAVGKAKASLSMTVSKYPEPDGLLITEVRPDHASERAGILAEDIITRINGDVVKTNEDLEARLGKHNPGEVVTLDLVRNSKPVQVKVTLEAADPN
jgi:serine protease Do